MLRRLREGFEPDRGFSLAELLVSMGIMAIISAITMGAVLGVFNSYNRVSNDSIGLNDVQIVSERMTRDIRQARGVYTGANPDHLKIWLDKNSDYVVSTDELITWSLVAIPGDPTHFNVVRTTDAGATSTIGRTLVAQFAFNYVCPGMAPLTTCPAASVTTTTQVIVDMQYNALIGHVTKTHHVDFAVKLRNYG